MKLENNDSPAIVICMTFHAASICTFWLQSKINKQGIKTLACKRQLLGLYYNWVLQEINSRY